MAFWSGLGAALAGSAAEAAGTGLVNKIFGGKAKRGPDQSDLNTMRTSSIYNEMRAITGAAKEYGIHPLYALGANVTNGPIASIGGEREPSSTQIANDFGQNIGAAVHRLANKDERALAARTAQQAVERGDLENELLKSQIAQIRSSLTPGLHTGGAQMIPGQSQTGLAEIPKEVFKDLGGGMEPGSPPGMGKMKYKGSDVRIPGKAWADANLDDGPANWMIQLMNTVPDLAKAEIKNWFKTHRDWYPGYKK